MYQSIEDCLIIGVDFSLYDEDHLVVFRKDGDKIYIINKFKDNEAVEIYNKLIGKHKEINEKLNNKSIKKKQNTKIRSFGIRTNNPALVHNLAEDLDRKLIELQEDGWKILSVSNTPCKEWDSKQGYFDSILFTIIAEISD